MGGQMKGTLRLEGVDAIEHSVTDAGKVSEGILELKKQLMGSINGYITEKHLSSEEVDLFEEKVSDDDGEDPKKGTKRKSQQFQKKRQKGNPASLGRRSR